MLRRAAGRGLDNCGLENALKTEQTQLYDAAIYRIVGNAFDGEHVTVIIIIRRIRKIAESYY